MPAVLVITGAVFAIALVATIAILALPTLSFAARMPRTRPALASITAFVALLVSALTYLRYSLENTRSWLWLSVAFLVLGGNQLVFGVVLGPERIGSEQASYFWTSGRLLVAVLLLVAALPRTRSTRDRRSHLRAFGALAVTSIAVLAAVETVLWLERARLPQMTTVPEAIEAAVTGTLPDLHPIVFALGATGALLYLIAAVGFLRRDGDPAPPWLPPALVLAGFSHIHHMFFPSVFTDWVSTADVLRAAFSLTLLIGLLWEVRGRFIAERDRSLELAAAYARERARVEELEELDRAKAEFFSVLTHELLQPVAALRGFITTLRGRWKDLDEETRIEIVERLDAQSGGLRDMAEGAATAMHLDDAGFSILPQRIRAANIIQEAAIAPAELANRLRVTVDPALEDVELEVDLGRILQVLRNLLTNAAKYADSDSPVELRGAFHNGEVTFSVVDRGPGLDPSEVSRIFQRFSRVRPPGKEHVSGSGLGLYIARRIAEAHGGTLEVRSAPGAGSEFRLILPPGARS